MQTGDMFDLKAAKPFDPRPQKGAWAPGNYMRKCSICECGFIGDKRAVTCADCAYKLDTEFECGIDEPGSAEPTDYPAYKDMVLITRTDYIRMLDERVKLNALENAGVDNWIGYDEAMSTLRKKENEQ